jgi:hypothetical protein
MKQSRRVSVSRTRLLTDRVRVLAAVLGSWFARAKVKAWSVCFWASALVNALPLLATRHLPFTDAPEHTAAMATLARLMPGGGGAPYEVAFVKSQYLLFHSAGAVVTVLVGDAVLANTVLLFFVALAWPVAMRSLLRAFGRDERLAVFAGMVFWNRATMTGLEPYIASVPLMLFCLAVFIQQLEQPTGWRAALLTVMTLALFYAHASTFLLMAVIAAAFVVSAWRDRPGNSGELMASVRRALLAAAPLAPSVLAALVWARVGGLKTSGTGAIERMPFIDSLVAMPIWTFDVWRSHVDEVAAGLWWIAYGAIVVLGWQVRPTSAERREWRSWLPFGCGLAMYLMIPSRIGDAGMLNVRIAPVLTLFALLGLRLGQQRFAHLPLALAVFATVVNAGDTCLEVRRVEREIAGDFDTILGAMRPGTRLALLNFEMDSPRTHGWPYPFAGAYHLARGGAVASFSFAELPHWSVQYAANQAPPAHAPFWAFDPCQYRYREDGDFYDYVLVQGDKKRFEAGSGLGPPFEPIASTARFTLYEKVGAGFSPPHQDWPDTGPCALPQVR